MEHRTAQLSRLASDLTLAEQHAREQLAKTLHDGLQQLLVSAALNLDRHVTREAQRGAESGRTARAGEASPRRGDRCRTIAEPGAVSSRAARLGIARRVDLAGRADTSHEYGLVVEVSADPLANSDRKDVRTLLFESVRELLFNAVKHAPGRSGHDRSGTRSG